MTGFDYMSRTNQEQEFISHTCMIVMTIISGVQLHIQLLYLTYHNWTAH